MSAEWAAVALSGITAALTGTVAYLLSRMREESLEERDKLKEWCRLGFVSRQEWNDYKKHQEFVNQAAEQLRNAQARHRNA